MRISIVQTPLIWQAPEANRQMLAEKLRPLAGKTDLVVLPEMFTTGFSMQAEALAEEMPGPTTQWMNDMASSLNAAITGSFICKENGKFYNRLFFFTPEGNWAFYDKKHLFGLAGEQEHFSTNHKMLEIDYQGFKIRPLICYDLRFPVWSRNNPAAPYDLLLYVANWPSRRAHHWKSLLMARAIENQSFVVGVNIVGTDGSGLDYAGDSVVLDFSGQTILPFASEEGIFTSRISKPELLQYRSQLPFLSDADSFVLK
jgi:predicted amidohydrolase